VGDVLVLCYHAVSSAWPASLAVTPEALEAQTRRLLDEGYRPATFTEATCDPPAGRTLAVTFDDAFASVHRHALPILRRLGVRATLFTPTRPIQRREPLGWIGVSQWSDGPYAQELTPLTWPQIDDLAEAGWEIGSHTESHPHLTQLPEDGLAEELEDSRQAIRRRLGTCTSIAYPYGDVDDRVATMASRAGYDAGAALGRWPGDRGSMRSPRVGIYRGDTPRRFAIKTSPVLRRLASVVRGR
jgi:peptidoglycan/xylan/chitin deacetylase (PgdA/CDA1 family)